MLLSRPRDRGAGGLTPLGAWLDDRLPRPELRAKARSWRRRRPFWAGVLLMASGAELIAVPLSPFGVLISLGIGGIAAIGIGLALILAGAFLWVAPHARAYVSLNALLLSVLSFAATNLGGFVVGTALGLAGSAMGFGWTPEPAAARNGGEAAGSAAKDDDAEADKDPGKAQGAGEETPAADAGGTAAQEESDEAPARGGALRRTLAVVLPLTFLAAFGGPAPSEAYARTAAGGAEPPRAANAPAGITTSRFSPEGFAFAGTEEIPTENGPLKVIALRMDAATLSGYRLVTREPGSVQQEFKADDLELRGNVKLYMKKFAGCLEGLVCLEFSPEKLPAPPVVPPFVFMTRVKAEQALVTADKIIVDGLAIRTGTDMASIDIDTGGAKDGKKGEDGKSEKGRDGKPSEDSSGDDEPGAPTVPSRPGMPAATEPRREPADVPWCEKVSLTFDNEGRRPVTEGTVTFTTQVVGALGVPWVTETSRRDVPDAKAGESVRKTWKVCVDKKHAGKFLLGRHLEHEAKVEYPEGALKPVDIPYP